MSNKNRNSIKLLIQLLARKQRASKMSNYPFKYAVDALSYLLYIHISIDVCLMLRVDSTCISSMFLQRVKGTPSNLSEWTHDCVRVCVISYSMNLLPSLIATSKSRNVNYTQQLFVPRCTHGRIRRFNASLMQTWSSLHAFLWSPQMEGSTIYATDKPIDHKMRHVTHAHLRLSTPKTAARRMSWSITSN